MKFKRTTAAILALTLTAGLTLTGCGGGSGNSSAATKSSTTAKTESNPESSAASDTGANPASAGNGEISLPLTDEKQTLTFWTNNDVTLMNITGGDMNNSGFYKELEKRTNVHIEWSVPASGSEQEQFNLLFTSGDLPDIMYNQNYIDGLDAAVDDGYILDLTPYMEQYAPNYMAAIKAAGPEVEKMVKTDAGRYAAIHLIQQQEQPPFLGMMVRQDWLDELGLSSPVTFDDWEVMLTKFKEEKNAAAPLSINSDIIFSLGAGAGVYGGDLFSQGFYQKDNKVGYYFYSDPDAGKEFLTIMNRWYTNGLIDADFTTADPFGDSVLVNNGSTGAFFSMYTYPSTMFKSAQDAGARFQAVLTPVVNEGDKIMYRTPNQITGVSLIISADCSNPELAIQWVDYLYSQEGAQLACYGIEGETYTLDAEGNPQFTELITQNPDGLSFDEALRLYTLPPGKPAAYMDWRRELGGLPQESIDMMEDWNQATSDYYYPNAATMSSEENAEFSQKFTDIQTFVKENTLAFITGEKSLDNYDQFIESLSSYGIDRCIELKQAALDRYNQR